MTVSEMNTEFLTEYDSLASNSAPPLDDYEVSFLLTQAQDKIVNRYQFEFENSEKRRREFANLIQNGVSTTPFLYISDYINQRSWFFELADNTRFILNERLKLRSGQACMNNKVVDVIPVSHDKYNYNIKNPFKQPNKNKAWRIDYKNKNNKKVVEILSMEDTQPMEYYYRYLKNPSPIIVDDLGDLSIDGISDQTECELADSIHREIVDLAVQLALEITGNPRLQSKIATDKNIV